ncbi:hypothetical protein [Sulfurimonas sp.]|uniref:hypothetical protein n=1 Tax=Sulfurimonas sp. TaxID=2022749 RepID=UPI0025E4500B|nr:hypothetical protein [Sulfurimonas sp.]MDD5157223.1 hypothetical protein [Sulfurimonas sp.]
MSEIKKYENIEEELPELPEILLNTIQSDVLEIRRIDKKCEKYIASCEKFPELVDASFVVYSKYIDKNNHKYEKFIFLSEKGAEICDVSGSTIELYGLLLCNNLSFTQEYENLNKK